MRSATAFVATTGPRLHCAFDTAAGLHYCPTSTPWPAPPPSLPIVGNVSPLSSSLSISLSFSSCSRVYYIINASLYPLDLLLVGHVYHILSAAVMPNKKQELQNANCSPSVASHFLVPNRQFFVSGCGRNCTRQLARKRASGWGH